MSTEEREGSREKAATSLRDVARLAGVSEATASRVLTSARQVSPELRARVLEAAARLGYLPNPHARALARARDASVGVVVHDVSDPYFSEIVRGALEAAEANGRMVLICDSSRAAEREVAYLRHFRAQRVEALLLAGSGRLGREATRALAEELLGFERTGGRAVLIGRHEVAADTVQPDNEGGARKVARHLAELGHRRIGVISGPPELTSTHDRLAGFLDELLRLGIELGETAVRPGGFTRSGGERAATELIEAEPELSAIFALNDVMAIGALAALRRCGLRVPEEVSVVGFDDIPVAGDLSPALTTVAVPMVELGRRALELALECRPEGYRRERLSTEIVVRVSTGPAAKQRR